mgnify:FL=1
MLVTLIGKNILYKIKLPNKQTGNYWIADDDGKKILNIIGKNNEWQIYSNDQIKILDPRAIRSFNVSKVAKDVVNIISGVRLKENSIYYLSISSNPNMLYILLCEPIYQRNFIQIKTQNFQEITIGKSLNCDIIYNNSLINDKQAKIFYSNGKLMLENYDTNYGIFLNDTPVSNKVKLLFNGDIIFIMGLRIVVIGNNFFITNPFNRVSYNQRKFELVKKQQKVVEPTGTPEEDVKLFSEKDFFARAPRITSGIEREKIKIEAPPQKQEKDEKPLIYTIGPSLAMGLVMLISMSSTISGVSNGTASVKSTVTSALMTVAMLISMILFPILNNKYEKRKKKKKEETRQKKYKEYINKKINQIDDVMIKQKNILFDKYLSAEECAQIILNKDSRLWERKTEDEDFLTIRVGLGDLPIEADIEYPNKEFSMEDDNLMELINSVAKKSKVIKNVPITASLASKNIAAAIIENDERTTEKFAQNLIMQLVALHSYADLKLVFLLKKEKNVRWEHMKTLPHIWDEQKEIRFWADEYDDMKDISRYLEIELNNRRKYEDKFDYRSFAPYYLIITDDYKTIENLKIVTEILNAKRNLGFGLFCITDNMLHLPNECQLFININGNNGNLFENEITATTKKEFYFDSSFTFFFENIGQKLSNIPIRANTTSKFSLPETYTFLEMYDAGRIEQLNILQRWMTNDSTKSLQAPIGIDTNGMPIVLDIHEKAHGPHGLIAGSTGSGKSEFIITYILSLAVNYHPNDVAMILIDYKGGGLAGAFQKGNVKLPHIVGTITNIDKVGLQRSLVSIQSELRRRQVKFNQAREKTDEGTIDIYKYQRLFHDGVVNEPIPHLLIICDEFAELKQQQPDFMDELISVARIGRSLGVHLILATQKPAGVVNDQIRSNSKFGICLKVQDRQDSMDVIKRPEAAELKRAGQFYIQVGNNEYFALGQSAWAGASYEPSDIIKKNVDNSMKFVSNIGSVIKKIDDTKKAPVKKDGEQLTNIVKYIYELGKNENIHLKPLWLENIPEIIMLDKTKEKYKIEKKENEVIPVIGEYDDPYNQRQGPVELDFKKQGNIIVYGNAESGKETLISTMVYDIITTYTVREAQMYLLDFGSEALKIFKDAPHVGDVVLSTDAEKINRLFEMIQREMKRRTEVLSNYGGDIKLYIKDTGIPMPQIIVVINNYEGFVENYGEKYDDILLTLCREGIKYGIIFVLTASAYNSVRYRLSQNFRQKIALQLNNEDDFLNIIEGVKKKRPAHVFGRGLIKYSDVYEFQTARICEPERWNSFIKDEIKKLNSEYTERAVSIPVLPNQIKVEDVRELVTQLDKLPIGIYKASLGLATYDFKNNLVNIISAKNVDVVAEYVTHLYEEFNLLEDVEVTVFDSEGIVQETRKNLKLDYQNYSLKIQNNLKKNKHNICIIIGIDKFLTNIGTSILPDLKKAEELKNYTFIVVDSVFKLKNHEYDDWYKAYITKDTGIWVGNGISDQYILRLNSSNRNLVNNCGDSFGYLIKQEEAMLIKLIGMKDDGDDNG